MASPATTVDCADDHFSRDLEAARPSLFRYARRLTHDSEHARDLTQDTMLRAWSSRARFELGSNMKAWLFTISRNLFLTEVRRARPQITLDDVPTTDLSIEPSQELRVLLNDVASAWNFLSHEHQHVLSRLSLEGLSCEEIALIDGIPVGTVKSRVARARSKLRNHVEAGTSRTTVGGQDILSLCANVDDEGHAKERPVLPVSITRASGVMAGTGSKSLAIADQQQIAILRKWRAHRAITSLGHMELK